MDSSWTRAPEGPTASDRRWNNLKGCKDFHLKATARIWPCQDLAVTALYVPVRIASCAGCGRCLAADQRRPASMVCLESGTRALATHKPLAGILLIHSFHRADRSTSSGAGRTLRPSVCAAMAGTCRWCVLLRPAPRALILANPPYRRHLVDPRDIVGWLILATNPQSTPESWSGLIQLKSYPGTVMTFEDH